MPSDVESRTSGAGNEGSIATSECRSKLMGKCPVVEVAIQGISVPCLLDTGSMVTTVTEELFHRHFHSLSDQLQHCRWLQLRAANGLEVPYLGYLEVDIHVLVKMLPKMGVLVVRDSSDLHTRTQKSRVPGLLGMNVISQCYNELFLQHGSALFQAPLVKSAGEAWKQAFTQCHQLDCLPPTGCLGNVRVAGRTSVCIPAGSSALFEPVDNELPTGILLSRAFLSPDRGQILVPVINVETREVWLPARMMLGTLFMVEQQISSQKVTFQEETDGSERVAVVQSLSLEHNTLDLSSLSWPTLAPHQEQHGKALLQRYSTVFSQREGDVGCTDLIEHEIPLIDDTPVRQRYRRLPPSQYEQVKAHIQDLLDREIVRVSCSPYSAPIVVVQKKDGTICLCVDYRQLNAKTRKDTFPLPRIEESLDALAGAKLFSTLDLTSGYNQVPMAEKDRQKTAFCTPFGLFEFNRMPFGLCNAPSSFQRLMERIFGDERYQSLLLYLDDIVIFSPSFSSHLQRLEMVLGRLQQYNLKLRLDKCSFFQTEVRYLGHVISPLGVATDPEKIRAVSEWKHPVTVKELRSFLGFASYYRRFVAQFAKHAAPLHKLVALLQGSKKRSGPIMLGGKWDEACEQAFSTLKDKLVTTPVLAYADFTKPFVLEVDASHTGLGAVRA
ncbi:Retrovirus-related Pol polyprotein from transposon opus [Merluccius polli]|uniref:ribonuclease H n=1 Tax=Merluccius polli TaxID=89951 RepID=A0AA47M670_MERPO|nr:Retrovirus-related Pol polyprotein from transposon opus [Merluccius polli]